MARRTTSLGPKPSLFFVRFVFSLLLIEKESLTRKRHFLLIFECLPLFLLSLFWPPRFSISLALSLSLSLSLLFFSFLLPSCLSFLLSFGSLLLSLSLFFCLLCFCFMKGTTSKYQIATYFYQSFLFLVSCLVFLSNPCFLSLPFPDFKLCFVQHQCFWFQKKPS